MGASSEVDGDDPTVAPRPWAGEALDRSRHLIALLDAEGAVLEITDSLARLLGGTRAALVGRPADSAPRWEQWPQARRRLLDALAVARSGRSVQDDLDLPAGFGPQTLHVELTPVIEAGKVVRIRLDAADVPLRRLTREPAERAGEIEQTLDTAGLALWTWDVHAEEMAWAFTPRDRSVSGLPLPDPPRLDALGRLVHPDHRSRAQEALDAALAGRAPLDLELRLNAPPELGERWLLVRGHVHRDAAGSPERVSGFLLDITERALARHENERLLHAERRAGRRATALQRIAAALSEAATSEQVAAVMVEESLRWLGADAARIELRAADDTPAVARSAGRAPLLADGGKNGPVRIMLPLRSRGLLRGHWTLAWHRDAPSDPPDQDWTGPEGNDLLCTLAGECAEALDRAQLYEQQRDIATVLQRTLLPTVLPSVPGALIAARYQPGGRGVDVGGDWYDVIPLPSGRTGLVIGDVEGHSAEAAAVMGEVRNALRAYAVEGSTPAIVMERLNRLLALSGITRLVTCCYLEFAAAEGTATVVLAGHPPPLVMRPDGSAGYVRARPNIALGVLESATFVETTVLLDPACCLLLYTDGLVETVSRALPEGLAALQGWAAETDPDDSTDELVETLIRRAREGKPVADDVAVLALRYVPVERRLPSQLRAVRRTLPLDPVSASSARRFVTDVLEQWGHAELSHQVALMTSELVTNSVLHTTGELEVAVFRDVDRLRVEVVDRSDRMPAVQAPDTDAPGGRGLLIIQALSQAWGVEGRGDGKAVWFEVALTATQ
jgi:PAS domain-containing protein/anti-sigma regulatory factor (Ser/Thr protein kinase)